MLAYGSICLASGGKLEPFYIIFASGTCEGNKKKQDGGPRE